MSILAYIFIPALLIVIVARFFTAKKKYPAAPRTPATVPGAPPSSVPVPPTTPAGNASTTPAKNTWIVKAIWAVAIILIIGLGIGSFNYFTSQNQENPFTPTSKLELKQTRKSGENVYHIVINIHRTKDELFIQCVDGLVLKGTGFGDQQYVGKWTQGNNNSGPFMLKFVDANNAPIGTIGQKEGDNLLIIHPI